MNDQDTAPDVAGLKRALQAERGLHRQAAKQRDLLAEQLEAIRARLDALEAGHGGGLNMGQITAGLAEIRRDLRAELATIRGEITALAEQVEQFVRHP